MAHPWGMLQPSWPSFLIFLKRKPYDLIPGSAAHVDHVQGINFFCVCLQAEISYGFMYITLTALSSVGWKISLSGDVASSFETMDAPFNCQEVSWQTLIMGTGSIDEAAQDYSCFFLFLSPGRLHLSLVL